MEEERGGKNTRKKEKKRKEKMGLNRKGEEIGNKDDQTPDVISLFLR